MHYKPWKKLYLSPGNTSRILGVTPATLRGWTNRGLLRAETTDGGHRRYPVSEVLRLAKKKGIELELPDDLSIRVLIVDDDPQFSRFLREYLQDVPEVSAVITADSGFLAGNLIPRFRPDVVLLDLRVPGLDGMQVCRLIKSDLQTRFIRVIAMSGQCSAESQQRVIEAGAEACLLKPFPAAMLKQVLGLAAATAEVA